MRAADQRRAQRCWCLATGRRRRWLFPRVVYGGRMRGCQARLRLARALIARAISGVDEVAAIIDI